MDSHVGQNLAVHFDASLVQAVDEAAIGEAEFADSSVDTLDPKSAEVTLVDLAVAVSVLLGTVDGGLGGTDGALAAAVEALGCLQNLLVLGVGGNASFYACYFMISLVYSVTNSLRDRSASSS